MAAEMSPKLPLVGEWYLESQTEDEFEVVDVDPVDGVIEIQYFNGDLSEITLEEWEAGEFEKIEAPEDWTGPMGKLEEGDTGYDTESFEMEPKQKVREGFEEEKVLLEGGRKGGEAPETSEE